jgi:hypothetical protein
VNTPTTHGSIGLTTGLDPAMTLGCGGFGGNITSDNITPKHLLNIKRVAYELRPAVPMFQESRVPELGRDQDPGTLERWNSGTTGAAKLPKVREKSAPDPISSESLTNRIDRFLATRGLAPAKPAERHETALAGDAAKPAKPTQPEVFVCEADVQNAVKTGQKLLIGERTIVTPAARDAGETAKVFVHIGGTM